MATSTVLLTGATGFIGFRICVELLRRSYRVKAVVRSEAKGKWLASRLKSVLGDCELEDKMTFVVVGNFVSPGAFDEAVLGADYIIHVASPITSSDNPEDWERDFKQVAIQGTLSVLEAARRGGSVKRIVITSSMVALFTQAVLFGGAADGPLHADLRISDPKPPYAHRMLAYQAGKVATLNETEAWVAIEKPAFDVIHICPSFVTGRDDLTTNREHMRKFSSNWHSMQIILGHDNPVGKPLLTCHNDDVARCHVLALDTEVRGNQSFLVSCNEALEWDDAKKFVEKRFPDAVSSGILPNNGRMPTVNKSIQLDVMKTEETFAFKHVGYEAQVLEVVGQYLELEEPN